VFAVIALVAIRLFDLRILDSVFALLGSLIILKWSADLIRKSWREVLFNRS
ncbi:MAG: cation transporter, partial [Bacteroidetes bacterium]|nr:cation transporter [Bacteroidota bacterium]